MKNENNTSLISTFLEVLFGTIQSEFFEDLPKEYLEVFFFKVFSGPTRSGLTGNFEKGKKKISRDKTLF